MHGIDGELLLLSRSGRTRAGALSQAGRARSAHAQAAYELACAGPHRAPACVRLCAGFAAARAAVTAALAGGGRSEYGRER